MSEFKPGDTVMLSNKMVLSEKDKDLIDRDWVHDCQIHEGIPYKYLGRFYSEGLERELIIIEGRDDTPEFAFPEWVVAIDPKAAVLMDLINHVMGELNPNSGEDSHEFMSEINKAVKRINLLETKK